VTEVDAVTLLVLTVKVALVAAAGARRCRRRARAAPRHRLFGTMLGRSGDREVRLLSCRNRRRGRRRGNDVVLRVLRTTVSGQRTKSQA